MRKTDFEPKYLRELNRELEYERKGKMIFKYISAIFLTIVVIGPTVLLVVLNADWIDKVMGMWQAQFALFVFLLAIILYLWIRWKINR